MRNRLAGRDPLAGRLAGRAGVSALLALGSLLALSSCTPVNSPPLILEGGVCADTSDLFTPTPPTATDESGVSAVLYVDAANPAASDANPGTQALPLRTLGTASALATANNARRIGTKVVIGAGIYRDPITLSTGQNMTSAPLVFEAAQTGQTTISGADIWTGWQPGASANTYTHVWPYTWGLAPYPDGWADNVVLTDIVRRREMVFVNDVPYTEVLTQTDLAPGKFFVSEPDAVIYITTSPGVDLNAATVEVSTRPELFHADGRTNLVLRGLTFTRGNPTLQSGEVNIVNSNRVTVENCQFLWSNWDGLDILTSSNITVRGVTFLNNGASGMEGYELKNSLFDSNEISQSNWRGAQGGFYGWAVAGAKFGALHEAVFSNQRSEWNQTRGFWFDSDHIHLVLDTVYSANNYGDGVFLEANEGPILIRNSTFLNNTNGVGISGAASADVTLAQNIIAGNQLAQLQLTGDLTRQVTNWETNATFTVEAQNWLLTCNTIASTAKSQLLFDTPNWPSFLTTLTSQKDAWYTGGNTLPFRIGLTQLNYNGWQAHTK